MQHPIFYGFYERDCSDQSSLSRSHLQSHVIFFLKKSQAYVYLNLRPNTK